VSGSWCGRGTESSMHGALLTQQEMASWSMILAILQKVMHRQNNVRQQSQRSVDHSPTSRFPYTPKTLAMVTRLGGVDVRNMLYYRYMDLGPPPV
jgi:hypothetical protein